MLQIASLTGVLKILLLIALFYYGFKILLRIFAPMLLQYFAKKVSKKFGEQFGNPYSYSETKEGEVVIDKVPNRKESDKKIGEYVDFEEID